MELISAVPIIISTISCIVAYVSFKMNSSKNSKEDVAKAVELSNEASNKAIILSNDAALKAVLLSNDASTRAIKLAKEESDRAVLLENRYCAESNFVSKRSISKSCKSF